jgi:hypothetical protein
MRIQFTENDRDLVLSKIKAALDGRSLADILEFKAVPGTLSITISKLGTSILSFAEKTTAGGLEYTLASEKIAFAHKSFKAEVTEKILKIVEKAGGKVMRT